MTEEDKQTAIKEPVKEIEQNTLSNELYILCMLENLKANSSAVLSPVKNMPTRSLNYNELFDDKSLPVTKNNSNNRPNLSLKASAWKTEHTKYFGIETIDSNLEEILPVDPDEKANYKIEKLIFGLHEALEKLIFDLHEVNESRVQEQNEIYSKTENQYIKRIEQDSINNRAGARRSPDEMLAFNNQKDESLQEIFEIDTQIRFLDAFLFSGEDLTKNQYIFVKKTLDVINSPDKETNVDNLLNFLLSYLGFTRRAEKKKTLAPINNTEFKNASSQYYEANTNIKQQFEINNLDHISVLDCVGLVCGRYAEADEIAFIIENKNLVNKKDPEPQFIAELISSIVFNHNNRVKSEFGPRELYHMVLLNPKGTFLNLYSMTMSRKTVEEIVQKTRPTDTIQLRKLKHDSFNGVKIKGDLAGPESEMRKYFNILSRLLAWLRKVAGDKDVYVDKESEPINKSKKKNK